MASSVRLLAAFSRRALELPSVVARAAARNRRFAAECAELPTLSARVRCRIG